MIAHNRVSMSRDGEALAQQMQSLTDPVFPMIEVRPCRGIFRAGKCDARTAVRSGSTPQYLPVKKIGEWASRGCSTAGTHVRYDGKFRRSGSESSGLWEAQHRDPAQRVFQGMTRDSYEAFYGKYK